MSGAQDGEESGRAAAGAQAVRREQRQRRVEEDVRKLIAAEPDPGLDEFVSEAARRVDLSELD